MTEPVEDVVGGEKRLVLGEADGAGVDQRGRVVERFAGPAGGRERQPDQDAGGREARRPARQLGQLGLDARQEKARPLSRSRGG